MNNEKFNPILLQYGIKTKNLWNNEEERKIVLKYVYDYGEKCNWCFDLLTDLEDKLMDLYANSCTESKSENFFVPFSGRDLFEKKNMIIELAFQYLSLNDIDSYSLNKYKEIIRKTRKRGYNSTISESDITSQTNSIDYDETNVIAQKTVNENNEGKKINPVLLEYGIRTTNLYSNFMEEKIVCKYIYDYCKEQEFDMDKIRELAKSFNLRKYSTTKVVDGKKVRFYEDDFWKILKICHDYEAFFLKSKEYFSVSSATTIIFDRLFRAQSIDEILQAIDSKTISKNVYSTYDKYLYLKTKFEKTVESYGHEKLKLYEENLSEKFNMYLQLYNKQLEEIRAREYLKKLERATNVIEIFVASDSRNIKSFCDQYNISMTEFRGYVDILKDNNLPLYNDYTDIATSNKKQTYVVVSEKIKLIVCLLGNGIEENGVKRNFDLIDFCQIANSLSPDDIMNLARNLVDKRSYSLLKKFVSNNKKNMRFDSRAKENILSMTQYINFEKDQDGYPIPGTGEEFANSKKIQLMEYLNDSNVPLNLATYNMAFNRYRKGFLDLSKEKVKVKVTNDNS